MAHEISAGSYAIHSKTSPLLAVPRVAQLQRVDAVVAGTWCTWCEPVANQGAGQRAEQVNLVKYASMAHEISAGGYAIHSKCEPHCGLCRVWFGCKALVR